MRAIRITFALVVVLAGPVLGQHLPRGAAETVGMSSERLERIDEVMQGYVDASRAAGIAVMVVRDGRVVKESVYGWADREAQRPLQTDALFRIASQTKAVTSVAVMMLVEEGKLRLSDPARQWMPSLAQPSVAADGATVPARRPIAIRDLLTHSAGVSYGTNAAIRDAYGAAGLGPSAGAGWYFADKGEPICASMDRLGTLPFMSQPGESFVYGYSTDILGCIVERVSGESLADFFRARILGPLAMNDSYFYVPDSERSRMTAVYAAGPDGLQRAPEGALGQGSYLDGPRTSFSGGAGLVSTIEDYARFLQMLLNGGELDGVRLLSPQTVTLMTQDHLGSVYSPAGLGFGLGFQILQEPGLAGVYGSPGTFGWAGAYATTYWVDPVERIAGLIMTQTLPSGGLDAADRFRTMVYSAIVD